MLLFPSNQVGRSALAGSVAGRRARQVRRVLVLLVICPFLWADAETAGQQEVGPEAAVESAPGSTAGTVQETLARIDDLISEFDTRIEGIRARAEALLSQADSVKDPDQQMRLEELYGRLMATAQGLEEQRLKLRAMRDQLATSVDAVTP